MYAIVAGGGMVGGGLVQRLMENKHDVVLIEKSKELCEKIYSQTGVIAIEGSAAQIGILKEAKVSKADVLVAATGIDADNLAAAVLAKSFNVPQIIVRMRDPAYENAYKVAGVHTILRVTDLMVNQMMFEIEKPEVKRITTIGSGRANIFRVVVPDGARVAGKSVKDIAESRKFPRQCSFIAVYNKQKDEFTIPRGKQIINEQDELFMISAAEDIKAAADFITNTAKSILSL